MLNFCCGTPERRLNFHFCNSNQITWLLSFRIKFFACKDSTCSFRSFTLMKNISETNIASIYLFSIYIFVFIFYTLSFTVSLFILNFISSHVLYIMFQYIASFFICICLYLAFSIRSLLLSFRSFFL